MLAVRISRPSTVPHRPHCVAFLTAPRYRLSRMLERLELANVGPAPAMALAPRINLITGDNGLGKSFLLDVAWWALTRNWPRNLNPRLTAGYAARPTNVREPATLRFTVRTATGDSRSYESAYSALDEGWPGRPGRPYNAGLVVYAHVDGGFSVWDPSRNYWQTRGNLDVQDRVPGYVFAPQEVWTGLTVPIKGSLTRVCKGLLDDWSSWIRERGTEADLMTRVLGTLTVQGEPVEVGPIVRLSVNDAQDIPSIRTEYSDAIPIVHASAGVRRIAALAYMLVWSWSEHLRAAEQLGLESTRQIVLLFDEIEAHLHPRWQRAVVPAVLKVMNILSDAHNPKVQLLAATHSPLVLASPSMIHFDPVPEPRSFDKRARIPGNRWRAAHPHASRPGDFWSPFKGDLATGFHFLCAYSAMYEAVGTVDHFVSWHEDRSKAYEWANYRYSAGWINSSKKRVRASDLMDPFTVKQGWFEIILPSRQLAVAASVPCKLRPLAEYTIGRLHLVHDERGMRQRREWYRRYRCGELTLCGLKKKAPLIAAAVVKAGL